MCGTCRRKSVEGEQRRGARELAIDTAESEEDYG
jgi:hypothetical protein